MAFDEKGKIYSAANQTAGAGAALDTDSSWVNVGRAGLSRPQDFTALVQKADANRDLTFTLEYTVDNGTTVRQAASILVPAGTKGQITVPVSAPEFQWERYTAANIDIRVNVASPTHAQAGDWDAVAAYVNTGEPTIWGRKSNDSIAN